MKALVLLSLLGMGSCLCPIRAGAAGTSSDMPLEHRCVLGIELGKDSLGTVARLLGKVRRVETGDAAEAEFSQSYVFPGADSVCVVFASNAEMAGEPDFVVTDIRISSKRSRASGGRPVGIVTPSAGGVRTGGGLRLGLTKAQVLKLLGRPKLGTERAWAWSWAIETKFERSDPVYASWAARRSDCFDGRDAFYTTSSEIRVIFVRGVVAEIRLVRSDSVC